LQPVVDINRTLIKKAQKGQWKAQKELYEKYTMSMFNICMRMLNDRYEAEDILQESFADAFRRLHTFRFESTFGAWLRRIVINNCLNAIKAKKEQLTYLDDMSALNLKEENYTDEPPEGLTVSRVMEAMETLPKGCRTILSLYLFEGYDHTEIAQILNISESTSKTQYMHARKKIRKVIEEKRATYG